MLLDILKHYFKLSNIPDENQLKMQLDSSIESISTVNRDIRELDSNGNPGGIIQCDHKNVILVPDLHGRREFFYLLIKKYNKELLSGKLIIVCLGDYVHTECVTRSRWLAAYDEFKMEFKSQENMNAEMADNLNILMMLMATKENFPNNFFMLKGNHDNILNESTNGNKSFKKYVDEGSMVLKFIKMNYSVDIIKDISTWEKLYPLMVIGDNFLASHSEPKNYYNRDEIVNYRSNYDIIYDLTWTRNGDSDSNLVPMYINMNLTNKGLYFGGHRHIKDLYKERANGKYIQIHNPTCYPYVYIDPDKQIDLNNDIHIINGEEDARD